MRMAAGQHFSARLCLAWVDRHGQRYWPRVEQIQDHILLRAHIHIYVCIYTCSQTYIIC